MGLLVTYETYSKFLLITNYYGTWYRSKYDVPCIALPLVPPTRSTLPGTAHTMYLKHSCSCDYSFINVHTLAAYVTVVLLISGVSFFVILY